MCVVEGTEERVGVSVMATGYRGDDYPRQVNKAADYDADDYPRQVNKAANYDADDYPRPSTPPNDKKSYNLRTKNYEFMGPPGTLLMTFFLPLVVLTLYLCCNKWQCAVAIPQRLPDWTMLWHPHAYMIVVGWFIFQVVLYALPLGYTATGTLLADGSRLQYRMNGIHAFVISHVLFAVIYHYWGVAFIYDNYLALATASFVFSSVLAFYMYLKSFQPGALLAVGGNTGNAIYDWFIGRELNPRLLGFDWKVFCEMRPGLIGWVLINYSMAAKQYELNGEVSFSMILVCFFQAVYILDALWFEEAILTTMDVVHDGFGFMLIFGDLCWLPFTYSLQTRFLVDNPISLSNVAVVGIVAINALGYATFRLSNSQKNQFRCDPTHPSVVHLQTISTKRGTKLLVSGWWGICRHPNYVGDLVMALSWSLPCGIGHVLPYFYVTYFTVLLIHRQLRDEHHCKDKYGSDWDRYCQKVPWRLIPKIY